MTTTGWTCSASSALPSDSWPGYAERLSALLRAVSEGLPGEVAWHASRPGTAVPGPELDPFNGPVLARLLEHGMTSTGPLAGTVRVHGVRELDGQQVRILLRAAFGRRDLPATVAIEVEEPGAASLWWYPDEVVTRFVGGVVSALQADRAEVLDAALLRRLAEVGGPLDVGSHTYVPRPIDPAELPRTVRQVPCGSGALLIAAAPDPDAAVEMLWRVADLIAAPR